MEEEFALLRKNVEKHITITDNEMTMFLMFLEETHYHKNEIIARAGDTFQNFIFIVSGCIKTYLIDDKGDQHMMTIAIEDWWVTDIKSFVNNEAGSLFIETVESTHAFVLSKKNQALLFERIPKFQQYFRSLTERAFAVSQQRILDMMSLSAQERFEKFVDVYPQLLTRISQKQIASYIGVTPSFFSRMLGKSKK